MKRYNTLMVIEVAQTAKNKDEATKEVRRIFAGIKPVIPATTNIRIRMIKTERMLF